MCLEVYIIHQRLNHLNIYPYLLLEIDRYSIVSVFNDISYRLAEIGGEYREKTKNLISKPKRGHPVYCLSICSQLNL